jgi:hypothetical protein
MAIYTEQQDGNLNFINIVKNDLVSEIKDIIEDWGSFSIGDVEAESSPFLEDTKGSLTHLIEFFDKKTCRVNVYSERHGDESIDTYSIKYRELSESNLAEILDLCERYREIKSEE